MSNFLILLRYRVPIEKVEEFTPAHRAYLKTLYAAESLLFSGPFVPRTGGVLWAQARGRAEIHAMISHDPFYENGIAEYEVVEFNPVFHASTLDALFERQERASGNTTAA